MAKRTKPDIKACDPLEVLDLIENCPPEYEKGDMIGTGAGQGVMYSYRNYEIDFRKCYRVHADMMANDATCPYLRMSEPKTEEAQPS